MTDKGQRRAGIGAGDADGSAARRAATLRLLRYLAPMRGRWFLALGIMLTRIGMGVVPVFVIQRLIDNLADSAFDDVGYLAQLCGLLVAVGVLEAVLGYAERYVRMSISAEITAKLRADLFSGVFRRDFATFQTERGGDLLFRLGSDVDALDNKVSGTSFDIVRSSTMAVVSLLVMLFLDWRLAALALTSVPVIVLLSRRAAVKAASVALEARDAMAAMMSFLYELISLPGYLLARTINRGMARSSDRFMDLNENVRAAELRDDMATELYTRSAGLAVGLVPVAMWLLGTALVVDGSLTIGTLASVVTVLVGQFTAAVSELGGLNISVESTSAIAERIFVYLDDDDDGGALVERSGSAGSVVVENLEVSYPGADGPALRDVSMCVDAGERVAIVGPSGAGKTSIMNVLSGLVQPVSGRVLLGGQDLRDVAAHHRMEGIAIVLQAPFMINASVAENLRIAAPEATDAELVEACRIARVDDVVAELPDGYDTQIGEFGSRLSGGERQRLAIARAVLQRPDLLLLDEAFSQLDGSTERSIVQALLEGERSVTIIMVTHRTATAALTDRIYLLEEGRLTGEGGHDDLVERSPTYAELCAAQRV